MGRWSSPAPEEPPRKPAKSVVICVGHSELDMHRCVLYIQENGLGLAALTHHWPTARNLYQTGKADAILVPPGDEHRADDGVIEAGPADMPLPQGVLTPDEVHLIRRMIALGEDTGTIILRVTQFRRQRMR